LLSKYLLAEPLRSAPPGPPSCNFKQSALEHTKQFGGLSNGGIAKVEGEILLSSLIKNDNDQPERKGSKLRKYDTWIE
jgi:hypothetical protein